ncbi:hypothetical protein SDC9_94693 [bioreactor metagenome]|uniref:Uncharacterized protein n=1 Tax=bioreactor metagenome TaxID=1076179 RepID=A0A645A4H2_9ZZZZ
MVGGRVNMKKAIGIEITDEISRNNTNCVS